MLPSNEPPVRSVSAETYTNTSRVSIDGTGKVNAACVVAITELALKPTPPSVDLRRRIVRLLNAGQR